MLSKRHRDWVEPHLRRLATNAMEHLVIQEMAVSMRTREVIPTLQRGRMFDQLRQIVKDGDAAVQKRISWALIRALEKHKEQTARLDPEALTSRPVPATGAKQTTPQLAARATA